MYARIGESFEHTETLDEETISAFAHMIGDLNPLHHNRMAAASSRFGGIIASGPHCFSILLSQVANYFSKGTSMVGLEFTLKFHAPARPGGVLRFPGGEDNFRESDKEAGHALLELVIENNLILSVEKNN